METKDTVKQIALEVFGTNDGIRPKFPKGGELIQAAMEESFKAGIKEVIEWVNQEEHLLYVPEGDKEPIDHGILLRPSKWQAKLKEWE